MSRPVRPRSEAALDDMTRRGNGPAWLIIFAGGGFMALAGLVSVAGGLASLLTGHGWVWRTGPEVLIGLGSGETQEIWPDTPIPLIWAITGFLVLVLTALVVTGAVLFLRWRRRRSDPAAAMARPKDVAALTPKVVAERAKQLRPSLVAQDAPSGAHGVQLGELKPSGPKLYASWEDTIVAIMGPRAGKTTSTTVPPILDAPGAVMATSVKSDILTETIEHRRRVGHCWVFDPQGIAYTEQAMWVDLFAEIKAVEDARRLASHFIADRNEGGKGDPFWQEAGKSLLTALILAAAVSGGSLRDVWKWVNSPQDPEPVERLAAAGHSATADGLRKRQLGPADTIGGIYETARTAAQCLESEQIMRWVTPPDRPMPKFDARRFITSPETGGAETLYLLSKDEEGAARPLVSALVDQVFYLAQRRAEANAGRLDPPMLAVLDEAANVCRIPNLPAYYSHLGSRGIVPITILQSYAQGKGVWGELGMDALWGASTVRVIGSGLADPKLLQDLSLLIGDHDVEVVSRSRDARGGWSESISTRRQRIFSPEDVHTLPRGEALVFATGCRPALISLDPWYASENADEIAAASAAERAELSDRARKEW